MRIVRIGELEKGYRVVYEKKNKYHVMEVDSKTGMQLMNGEVGLQAVVKKQKKGAKRKRAKGGKK